MLYVDCLNKLITIIHQFQSLNNDQFKRVTGTGMNKAFSCLLISGTRNLTTNLNLPKQPEKKISYQLLR